MKIVIPVRRGRVSPVFDVARKVLVVEVGTEGELRFGHEWLDHTDGQVRPQQLVGLGAELLICGHISSSLEESIASAGVGIIGQVCGSAREVLRAFLEGELGDSDFVSPDSGIRARRYRRKTLPRFRRNGEWQPGKEGTMPGGDGYGPPGGGRRGRGGGRGGGPYAAGPGGECVCPNCGHTVPHVAGKPCLKEECPRCGARMTRR